MSRRQLLLLLVSLLWPKVGWAAGEWIDMYPADRLIGEKSRLESRANQMLDILRTLLGKTDLPDDQQRLLESVRVEAPLSDDAGVPLNFFSRYTANAGVVTTPVFSLLFVEDLCTAYSWLYQRAYSLETIDEYVTMLRYRSAAEFPGGQYLSPLPALGIPLNAYDDPEAGPLGIRFRNSAYAFIIAHELGHILAGHPSADHVTMEQSRANETAADDFAVQTLAFDDEIPMGAILYFLAQAYLMPSLGQFKAQGRTEQDWVVEMQTKITHPLTAERLQQIAAAIDREAEAKASANSDAANFVAFKLLKIADWLSDVDLQQCMAVAAARAPISALAPQRTSPTQNFLSNCVKQP